MLPADDHALTGDESLVLPAFDAPPSDPMTLLVTWLRDAQGRVAEPRAATLATADAQGRPSSRVVKVKQVSPAGLVFTTRESSRKGRDLAVNPHAAITFHWRETVQQVNVTGQVVLLDDDASDALFESRGREARATAVVSVQGAVLEDEQALAARAEAALRRPHLIRPATWHGYCLVPERVEFWQGRASRLHRRLEYVCGEDGWISRRLQP
ncbi:pyridoxal 5'-phosphate synthase [Nocardioides yefusunii]|uniref:Pyridoxal 5'-phosphate synthase n=1 Tax=Nocardioides yefusunii TaxID=2500546 RepID=A0ABW1R146_9ACTN|nr:pyridoxal 5'-phosphate synthase [Nocardioides yefusunii]